MPFSLTSDDLQRMQQLASQRVLSSMHTTKWLFVCRVALWLAIGFVFFNLYRAHVCCGHANPFIAQAAFGFVATGGVVAVLTYLQQSALTKATVAPGGWFTSSQEVEVLQSGLCHKSSLGEMRMPWSAFRWHAEDERNFYLFVDNAVGFVYPKAAIAPEQQALLRGSLPSEA